MLAENREIARTKCIQAIREGYPEPTRVDAIRRLGSLKDVPGSHEVYDLLVGILGETSFGARNTAIGALATYGNKDAIPLIEPFKSNSLVFFRGSAEQAIRQLESK